MLESSERELILNNKYFLSVLNKIEKKNSFNIKIQISRNVKSEKIDILIFI